MPLVGRIYTAWAGTGMAGIFVRGVAAAVCLLPPTLLMGATLPAIGRWVDTSPRGVSWLGFFYGGNTAGAVIGSLLAGYYLLRVHDVAVTTYVAVGINVVVALLALGLAARAPFAVGSEIVPVVPSETMDGAGGFPLEPVTRPSAGDRWPVYVAIALSGLTALACEVLWTRTLVAPLRRHHLHFLPDPRRLPRRAGHWQQCRGVHRP